MCILLSLLLNTFLLTFFNISMSCLNKLYCNHLLDYYKLQKLFNLNFQYNL